jgi:hypothetical protein
VKVQVNNTQFLFIMPESKKMVVYAIMLNQVTAKPV